MRFRFEILKPKWHINTVAAVLCIAGCAQLPQLAPSQPPTESGIENSIAQSFQPITDVPIPNGARLDVDKSLLLGGGNYWTGRLVIAISESPGDAFARYLTEMPQFGWKHITSVQSDISILSFALDSRIANIQIEGRTLGGSILTIVMSPRAEISESSNNIQNSDVIRAESIE